MAVENASERPVGWYVSRVVNLKSAQVRTLGLLGGVVTPGGATLRIGEPVQRALPMEDHVSYAATLSFPGLLSTKLKVELVVSRYSGGLAEVGLRPTARVPQRRIGAERYFEAAWAVLEGLARAARDGGDVQLAKGLPAWTSSVARAGRRVARAS